MGTDTNFQEQTHVAMYTHHMHKQLHSVDTYATDSLSVLAPRHTCPIASGPLSNTPSLAPSLVSDAPKCSSEVTFHSSWSGLPACFPSSMLLMLLAPLLSSSSTSKEAGNRPSRGAGRSWAILQSSTRIHKLSKFSEVTPSAFVKVAPPKLLTAAPPFSTLMSVANSVASTPSGHSRAAKTRIGMKLACPRTVSSAESPNTNSWSLSPRATFARVTSSS
mmetsp:Transcript_9805/g.17245  ORF Transcript_9805/g.17245 Transcript_9805/m.17245 type:complete len:219 (-) Transcript_9805:176-832(-)